MPSKPIQQGYKLFGITDYGYLYAFRWSSKAKGMQLKDTVLHPTLTRQAVLYKSLYSLFLDSELQYT
jgi:hypothetical protein